MIADERTLDAVANALRNAQRVLFVTGAGLSADSGLPTYRGVGGLYEHPDPRTGMPIEEALSGRQFERDPASCWIHLARLERACRGARPNRGHHVIAEVQARAEVVVLTQNVDGLHEAAGSRDVIAIHGDVRRLRCPRCPWRDQVPNYAALALPPRCPDCAAVVRPDVVLFGEWLPPAELDRLHAACARPFDLVFSIGTSSAFPYVVTPIVAQVRARRSAVEINPARTDVSALVTWRIEAGAAVALDALWRRAG